jgi:cell division protein FtsW
VKFKSSLASFTESFELDRGILLIVFSLLGIGLVMVYSASYINAIEKHNDGLFFFKRQMFAALLGMMVMVAVGYIPWKYMERFGLAIWGVSIATVLLTLIPGIGVKAGGAARWLQLPLHFRFQPGELMKISLSLVAARWVLIPLDRDNIKPWLGYMALTLLPLMLLMKQPDFGSFVISAIVLLILFFSFGLKWRYIILGLATVVPTFAFLIMSSSYRRARVLAFLNPWADPDQKGFQIIQSLLSFYSGGATGVGLGQGQSKLYYLPEAHTDFIFSVIGEELGFVGVAIVLGLFGYLIVRGLQIAFASYSPYAKALALGVTSTVALSVLINTGMVMGLLPTKGLTLPFISYGGSSLLVTCFAFGILLNISRSRPGLAELKRG